jgi:hypothetical protein
MIERSCVVCGENMQIILDDNERIMSGGYYFGGLGKEIKPRTVTTGNDWEYWECLNCYEDDE